ncbi:MAG: hypothetical protein NT121_08505, partial [Chloroflexi bacterium]|nr:hypothetical protein [Chloroflexota bacterium]
SLCHLLRYAGFLSHLFDQFFSSNPPFLSASFCPPPFLFIIGLVAESHDNNPLDTPINFS